MNIQFVYLGKRGGGVNDLISLLNSIDDIDLRIFSINNSFIRKRTSFLEERVAFDYLNLPKSKIELVFYFLCFKWLKIFQILKKNSPNFIVITMFHPLNFVIYIYKFFFNWDAKIYNCLHNDNKIQTFNYFYDLIIRLFDMFYCIISNKVFVLSSNVYLYSQRHFLLRYKNVVEIGFGVYFNPNSIVNNLEFYQNTPIKFVFFGKILPYKGLENLLEALKLLSNENVEFKCYVLGEGSIDYNTNLLPKNVIILNHWVSDDELEFYLKDCHFSVFPYSHCSQSGALSTALSNNLPVLVSDIPILRNQVFLTNGGYILEDNSPISIRNRILAINNNRENLFQLHKNLVKFNKGNSDWNNVWKNIKSNFN